MKHDIECPHCSGRLEVNLWASVRAVPEPDDEPADEPEEKETP